MHIKNVWVNNIMDFFNDKKILVTGGAGSIGSEIVKQLLEYKPDVIRIFDNDENGLFNLKNKINDSNNTRYLLGDVRDINRVKHASKGIDIIFHVAALKHVGLCENNPFDAVKTNVVGTQNIIEVAREEGVERVITISTDKAVNPVSVMGATKLLAERLTVSANRWGDVSTLFSCVRFGNVLGSRGSVIPIFKNQIKMGGPVTITDKDMTRFVMSLKQAVGLVLKSAMIMQGGETFILKMPRVKICDLADVLIFKYWDRKSDMNVVYIGKRDAEKLSEVLITLEESFNVVETDDMFILNGVGGGVVDIGMLNKSEPIDDDEIKKLIGDV
jgi:FlaA1/EpsC-like NDP-sugar epimerase